jgi:polysaccharide export outer membrane protein
MPVGGLLATMELGIMAKSPYFRWVGLVVLCGALIAPASAQTPTPSKPAAQTPAPSQPATQTPTPSQPASAKAREPVPVGVVTPPGYLIGADDQLAIRFWGDTQLSTDVVVRSDGRISVPLLNDVPAAGLTPEQLGDALEKAASKYITEPDATVIVKEIRSRKVYVIGQGVTRSGTVALNTEMNVLQVLAAAGGLLEYADKGGIVIIRNEDGKERRFKFNFSDVVKGKNLKQNILLQPGDTVVVN